MNTIKTKTAFTITELAITLSIIGVLIVVSTLGYNAYNNHSRTSQNKIYATEISQQVSTWLNRYKAYPKQLGKPTDPTSLLSSLSEDARTRVLLGKDDLPSQTNPQAISLRFCENPSHINTAFGVIITYWDYTKRQTVTQTVGKTNASDLNCVSEIIEQTVTGE